MTDLNKMTKAQLIDIIEAQETVGDEGVDINAAMTAIADHFNDPAMRFDKSIGEMVQKNRFEFLQDNVLGSICYGLDRKLDWFQDKLREDLQKVERAQKQAVGDEISLQQLERLVTFAENRQDEVTWLTQALDAAKAAYRNATGKDWAPYNAKQSKQPTGTTANDLEKRMAAMGVKASLTPTKTDGNTADAH